MDTLFTVLVVIAMLATLVVLGVGVAQMVRGGDPRRSNKLMRSRVLLQGVALVLFFILMTMIKH